MIPNSQLKYHPNRFQATRRYVPDLLTHYQATVGSGIPTISQFNDFIGDFLQVYNDTVAELPYELRPGDMLLGKREMSLFQHFAAYYTNGRNIFHFYPELTEQFRRSDVETVLLSSLNLPFRVLYLWFGPQPDLNLWNGGYFVDGAYINQTKNIWDIVLTTRRNDLDYSKPLNFVLHEDRYYYFSLDLDEGGPTVADAIQHRLETDKPFEHRPDYNASGSYEYDGKRVTVIDVHNESRAHEALEVKQGFSTFQQALKLVFNGLCFITAYSKDISRKYPEDTPKSLLEKFDKAEKAKTMERIKSKLRSMGYTKINFCGESIRKYRSDLPTGREVATHWRRGHWRNQACGAGMREHRLIWILPTIVRKDKGASQSGHIYLVEETPTNTSTV